MTQTPTPALRGEFDRYYDYEQLTAFLREACAAYPQHAELLSIGTSYEGRDIPLIALTNRETGPHAEKPAYWLDGNIHAGEVTGSATCRYTIWYLLTRYGQDELCTRLLDTRTFYILPRLTVDGTERYLKTPEQLRSSVRRYPFEDDRDGLQPADIDGDGEILQMRVRNPLGTWKVSERDPRLMVKRRPDEEGGVYYDVYREGLIQNYDGHEITIAPPRHGLDLNRNSPAFWAPEKDQGGAGPFPLSEPETRAVAQFFAEHRNIVGVQNFHTFSGVILRPFAGQADEQMPIEDLWTYQKIGERGTELTGYPCISIYHDFRYHPRTTLHGGFIDWTYDHLGIISFATELWDIARQAGIENRDFVKWLMYEHPEEDDLKILRWNDEHLNGSGFVNWRPFEHPQLGPAELGGWRTKFVWQNPPPQFLQAECHKNALFALAHAAMSPLLRVSEATAEPLGHDLYKLTVTVQNQGFLPTAGSKRAADRGVVRPIEVVLDLPEGAALLIGKARTEIGQLEGRQNKIWASPFVPGYPTDYQRTLEYLVRAPAGASLTVVARSDRAGTHRQAVRLA